MPTFAEEFDGRFRNARQRVRPKADNKKTHGKPPTDFEVGRESVAPNATGGVSLNDFQAYMPMHAYIFTPSGELWPASSVDSRLPHQRLVNSDGRPLLKQDGKPITIKASRWLDQHKPVEQMTWAPGRQNIIEGQLVSEGGWITRPGCRCFNLYRPPTIVRGNPHEADPWVDHVSR